MTSFTIDFEPIGRRGECVSDQSLLDCARQLNVDIVSICGGIGNCERCKVQVIAGRISKPTLEEEASLTKDELAQGYRLACQAYPLSDVKLHVPPESLTAPQRTQIEGLEVDVPPEPPVRGLEAHPEITAVFNFQCKGGHGESYCCQQRHNDKNGFSHLFPPQKPTCFYSLPPKLRP